MPERLIKSRYLITLSLKHRMAAVIKSIKGAKYTSSQCVKDTAISEIKTVT